MTDSIDPIGSEDVVRFSSGEVGMKSVREEVHEKVKKFQMDHNESSYKTALDRVLTADAPLKQRYGESSGYLDATGQQLAKHAAGRQLTNLAKQYMARKGGTFRDAFYAVSKISPGEVKAYLRLEPTDLNLQPIPGPSPPPLLPRGVGKATEILFDAAEGWTAGGVRDWVKQQGLTGGELARNAGGWSYTPQKRT